MKNKIKLTLIMTSIMLLTGCFNGESSYKDLDSWMAKTKKDQIGKIKPLPIAKEFIPVDFRDPADPFLEKQVLTLTSNDRFAPDMNRRKEALESYTLDRLKMTGSVEKDGVRYAMIVTPENKVHYVGKGNYVGTNYGKIVHLDESLVQLEERVKNSNEEWELKLTNLVLVEAKVGK